MGDKRGHFTRARSKKTCPACGKFVRAGELIGMSYLIPKPEREWLCHSCAVEAIGV